jgi:hypothetical protein
MDQRALELLHIIAQLTGIAQIDGIALSPLHGPGDVFAPNCRFNDVLHISHREAVARRLCPPHLKVEIITARCPVVVRAARAAQWAQHGLDPQAGLLDGLQIRAKDLDAQHAAYACGQHLGARLDGHPEDIGHAGESERSVHLLEQFIPGHRPLLSADVTICCAVRLKKTRELAKWEIRCEARILELLGWPEYH